MSYLGWPTLKSRTNAKLIMLYKIINIVDVYLDGDLLMSSPSHSNTLPFIQPYTRVDAYKYSFLQSTVKLWNTLPCAIVNQESFKIRCSHIIIITFFMYKNYGDLYIINILHLPSHFGLPNLD